MTEAEWQGGNDPKLMLEFLRGKATDRKLRLLAVGAVRSFWGLLLDPASQEAVSVAELAADDGVGASRLATAYRRAWDVVPLLGTDRMAHVSAARAAGRAVEPDAFRASALVMNEIIGLHAELQEELAKSDDEEYDLHWQGKAQGGRFFTRLLHDLWGNPFHPVTAEPSWFQPAVSALATSIDESQDFDRLPALSDSLRDAGCDNHEILTHCLSRGPHVRGCWVIDLALGRR